jgi:hypothetical protein
MTDARARILAWIEEERDAIVAFLQGFLRQRGPNPPGDTRSFLVAPTLLVIPMSFSASRFLEFPPPAWSLR